MLKVLSEKKVHKIGRIDQLMRDYFEKNADAVCSLIAFFLCAGNVKAEIKVPVYDSTCCTPDSLRFSSANYPVFCVSWKTSIGDSKKSP